MEPEVDTVLDRLRSSRSRPWVTVIDDADLDRPAEEEPKPEAVVLPYRWLIQRLGEGLQLTQAGYLPPAVVEDVMVSLDWQDEWIGKHNREIQTGPVLELRESAQRLGLLRKHRGRLLPTKTGRRLAADASALWWHLAARLPDARSEAARHAGILYLLTVAAGRGRDDAFLADGMSILGWARADTWAPLSPTDAFIDARDTWVMFRRLGLLPTRRLLDPEPPPSEAATRLARASLLGREQPAPRSMSSQPAGTASDRAAQLTVTLRGIEPPIWRQLVVPASLTLRELHAVIQTAMGWQGYHLHMFDVAGVLYGDVEEIETQPVGDEETFTVEAAAEAVTEFEYEYDFGDGWEHHIQIDQLIASVGPGSPHLVGGARACPPEDCGGVWGYLSLLETLADPSHPEHEKMLSWSGGSFDPEAFDMAATNEFLDLYDRQTRLRRMRTT